jgi:hypothetical protein
MAFDEYLADRIRRIFEENHLLCDEKRMMGGLCFMLNGKMCCGIHFSKKKQMDLLMARVGPEEYEKALEDKASTKMDFTGRPMTGFVFVTPEGFDSDKDLRRWIELCIAYNPRAKRTKKK